MAAKVKNAKMKNAKVGKPIISIVAEMGPGGDIPRFAVSLKGYSRKIPLCTFLRILGKSGWGIRQVAGLLADCGFPMVPVITSPGKEISRNTVSCQVGGGRTGKHHEGKIEEEDMKAFKPAMVKLLPAYVKRFSSRGTVEVKVKTK